MSISSGKQISYDIDTMFSNIGLISEVESGSSLPAPKDVSTQVPAQIAPVSNFNSGLNYYSLGMKDNLSILREDLLKLHSKIEETAKQFLDNDATLEQDVTEFTSRVDTGHVPGAGLTVNLDSALQVQSVAYVNKISKMMEW